jgi:hypothetical protein
VDLKRLARLCVYPFAIDICLALEERGVLELRSVSTAQVLLKEEGS